MGKWKKQLGRSPLTWTQEEHEEALAYRPPEDVMDYDGEVLAGMRCQSLAQEHLEAEKNRHRASTRRAAGGGSLSAVGGAMMTLIPLSVLASIVGQPNEEPGVAALGSILNPLMWIGVAGIFVYLRGRKNQVTLTAFNSPNEIGGSLPMDQQEGATESAATGDDSADSLGPHSERSNENKQDLPSVLEALERLQSLRSAGVIDHEELDRLKAQALKALQ